MKKWTVFSRIVFFLTVGLWILHQFVFSFPDWLVRVIGITMLLSIFAVVFTTVKMKNQKQK